MAQLFPPQSNSALRVGLAAGVLLLGGVAYGSWKLVWSSFVTGVGEPIHQPVPFSHQHHVGQLGLDCRYCHTGVEKAAYAGIPPTETCMTCHSQVWKDAPVLAPVRESWRTGQPLHWQRVNDVPDYVYFNHSVHVQKGVACANCHGAVAEMPLIRKDQTLYMRWCLECHEHPAPHLGPAEAVYAGHAQGPRGGKLGEDLVRQHGIQTERLSDCSVCHR